ncbi:MAG: hypothetical protein H7Y16_03825 [Candidatus Parcubacteria bacterium]|nr:hypothetical protein [Burkholderiales bacterium]
MTRRTALLALAFVPVLALAHHGWSEYDATRLLKLSGTIAESGYEHPHGFIRLDTPGKNWLCLLAPPSRMEARGLARDALKPGERVAVEGYANRGKPEEMRAERITAGGKTVELR